MDICQHFTQIFNSFIQEGRSSDDYVRYEGAVSFSLRDLRLHSLPRFCQDYDTALDFCLQILEQAYEDYRGSLDSIQRTNQLDEKYLSFGIRHWPLKGRTIDVVFRSTNYRSSLKINVSHLLFRRAEALQVSLSRRPVSYLEPPVTPTFR